METKPCNCGQTDVNFYPDENHYEPACWECYYTYDPMNEYNPDGGNICVDDWFPKQNDELPF